VHRYGFTLCASYIRLLQKSVRNRSGISTGCGRGNTGRNVRDRDNELKSNATTTAGDQSENEQDRTITENVRKAVSSDDALSTNAKNVKIITNNGTVTLRGPVKSQKEKVDIEAKAKQIAGVKNVDNQLEIAN
jgi:osmotically-inducible protein OsmY